MKALLQSSLAIALSATILVAQEAALTNGIVIKMVQSGVPTDTIVRTIATAEKVNFGFLPNDLAAMSNAKVPDDVFKAMARRDKTVGPTAAAPAPVQVVAVAATPTTTPPTVGVAVKPTRIAKPVSAPSGKGYDVKYSGGSLESLKGGDDLRLFVASDHVMLRHDKAEAFSLSPVSITEVSYGQEVHRRIGTAAGVAVLTLGVGAIIAFSKSKKHYIGMTWDDAGKKGGVALQADKNEYRGILTALEGVTGKRAVDTDEDAAKKNK
jgi:hypothetical protein